MSVDDETTQREDAIMASIVDMMADGLHVCDAHGVKVGIVRRYDLITGYMVIEEGLLARKEFYVPFHFIQSISPHILYLSIPKDTLTDMYLLPPETSPLMEKQRDPNTGREEVVIEHAIRSGYDGRLIEIDPVDVDEVKRDLVVGMSVKDANNEYVGEVTHIDATQETLAVKAALVNERVCHVPFTQIERVDPNDMCVTLLVPKLEL